MPVIVKARGKGYKKTHREVLEGKCDKQALGNKSSIEENLKRKSEKKSEEKSEESEARGMTAYARNIMQRYSTKHKLWCLWHLL